MVISSILAWAVGFALGALFPAMSLATIGIIGAVAGLLGSVLIYGGVALALSHKQDTGTASSPTYASSTLQSQTNNTLALPILYGKVKVAGNRIWQDDNTSSYVTRIVGFAEGEINAFTDIRLNDIKSDAISGIQIEKYYGTASQNVCSFVTGSTNAERAAIVGGLRYHAYLGIKVPRTDKIDGSYNLTTIAEGRKVRIYTDEDTYTVAYSNNPSWCLLDFLTCYNGARIGILNNGGRDDAKIKSAIDINSFIEAAAYCDEIVKTYQYTTALAGNNNDLVWIGRHANKALSLTYTAGATAGIALTDNDITVTFVNGVTKASDIVALVQTNPEIKKLVSVYNSASNTGDGLISSFAKTSFVEDNSSKRFTFNMIFDATWLVADVIEEFKNNCRGVLVKKGHKVQFKLAKPKAVSKVFGRKSIIQGSEIIKTLERKQRYDILDVKYIEPDISDKEGNSGEWAKCAARATLEEYFNEPAVSHSVEIYSVTNFNQAARLGWYYLNYNIRCYFAGSFSTGHEARDLEVGDVISLSDFVMNFTDFKVEILSVSETQEGIFTVSWLQYDPEIYNDELASLEPVIIYTNLNDVYAIPADVQSFMVSQNQKLAEFNWVESSTLGVTYEIRQGASWDSASVIASGLSGSSYSTTLTQKGTFTYWIKSKTKYQPSANAASSILAVQSLPDMNEIVSQNILIGAAGDFDNTYIYDGDLKLDSTNLWADLSPDLWADVGARYYADSLNHWGATDAPSGSYTSQVYDIGAILQNIISFNWDLYAPDTASSIVVEWRYSDDNISWSDWVLAGTGSFSFRYYQVKINLTNINNQVMYINNFIVTIDVPDRIETYTNRAITDASAGLVITYATDMQSKIASEFIIAEPHVIPASKTLNTYAVVTNSTAASGTVKLYNPSGALVTGNVNITVTGY